MTALGCSCHCLNCCSQQNEGEHFIENDIRLLNSPTNDYNYGISAQKGMNYHVMNTVWDPEYMRNQSPINPQYNGYLSPDQSKTPDNSHIQSFATTVIAKQKQVDDKRIYAVNINEPTSKSKDPVDTMVNWTQQLQEQLRNKKPRETSAGSTKQLLRSSNSNDY
jgi:hypothetical protein